MTRRDDAARIKRRRDRAVSAELRRLSYLLARLSVHKEEAFDTYMTHLRLFGSSIISVLEPADPARDSIKR
jgi:hypothetical protein